jgi:capsular polysaccharide biosynthesis protein
MTQNSKGKIMDSVQKDLENRKAEIKNAMELMFKANMTITDWDVPEGDDKEAAKILISIMQEAMNEIKADIEAGKYDYY